MQGRVEATLELLAHGADKTLEDKDGFTALRLALDRGYGDVADALNPQGDAREYEIGREFISQGKVTLLTNKCWRRCGSHQSNCA